MRNGYKDKLKKNILIRMKKTKNILGLSLLEALISTLIVGIGFIAILQMTTYSINSIDVSGERTKANYLSNMIAEDVIGHRDKEGSFSDFLSDSTNEFVSNSCATVGGGSANNNQSDSGPRSGKLYKDLEDYKNEIQIGSLMVEKFPFEPIGYESLAIAYLEVGNYIDAIEILKKAKKLEEKLEDSKYLKFATEIQMFQDVMQMKIFWMKLCMLVEFK